MCSWNGPWNNIARAICGRAESLRTLMQGVSEFAPCHVGCGLPHPPGAAAREASARWEESVKAQRGTFRAIRIAGL